MCVCVISMCMCMYRRKGVHEFMWYLCIYVSNYLSVALPVVQRQLTVLYAHVVVLKIQINHSSIREKLGPSLLQHLHCYHLACKPLC